MFFLGHSIFKCFGYNISIYIYLHSSCGSVQSEVTLKHVFSHQIYCIYGLDVFNAEIHSCRFTHYSVCIMLHISDCLMWWACLKFSSSSLICICSISISNIYSVYLFTWAIFKFDFVIPSCCFCLLPFSPEKKTKNNNKHHKPLGLRLDADYS